MSSAVAAIGVDADMVPARARAPGDRLAREVERRRDGLPGSNAQAAFTKETVVGLVLVAIGTTSVPMSQSGSASGSSTSRRPSAVERRQIALQVHHHVVPAVRIEFAPGREDPVGTDGRRDRSALPRRRRAHALGDLRIAAGDRHRARSPPRARLQTWTIIGAPAMSASGLPGSRVEAMRAGIRTIGFTGRVPGLMGCRSPPYGARTLWRRTAPRNGRAGGALRAFGRSLRGVRRGNHRKSGRMDSLEVNKGIAAVLVAGIAFFLTG